jgi:hypothetical protein
MPHQLIDDAWRIVRTFYPHPEAEVEELRNGAGLRLIRCPEHRVLQRSSMSPEVIVAARMGSAPLIGELSVVARMEASAHCSDDGETDRLRCNSYLL